MGAEPTILAKIRSAQPSDISHIIAAAAAGVRPLDHACLNYLGLDFAQLDEAEVVALLQSRTVDDSFDYFVTPNVDHIVRLSKLDSNSEPRRSYLLAGWLLCDSRILSLLASLQGITLPVVTGSDMTRKLITEIVEPGDRICVIGGHPGDIEKLQAIRGDIDIVQHIPPMGLLEKPEARLEAARFAAASRSRFILLSVGSPQQEMIASAIKDVPGAHGTALCVGAGIDFLTGRTRRAPLWMQRMALEWLHRLLSNPRRLWRRYLVDGPRIFRLAWQFRR